MLETVGVEPKITMCKIDVLPIKLCPLSGSFLVFSLFFLQLTILLANTLFYNRSGF